MSDEGEGEFHPNKGEFRKTALTAFVFSFSKVLYISPRSQSSSFVSNHFNFLFFYRLVLHYLLYL